MLRNSVVLFLTKKGKAFDPIGSGTLVFHEGRVYIISAAHVFEDLKNQGRIYLFIANKAFDLGKFDVYLTAVDNASSTREDDPLDLGAMLVPDEILDKVNGTVSFIQRDLIESTATRKFVRFYQAIGFPGKKNTKKALSAARNNKPFDPEIMIYSGEDTSDRIGSDERIIDELHTVMNVNSKRNYDDDGAMVNIPDMKGMSGGLIQGCFDYIPKSNGRYPTCAAAIIIERNIKNSSLIGVKFSAIYEWLDAHFC